MTIIAQVTVQEAEQKLRARGIWEQANQTGWVFHSRHNHPGWLYPVKDTGGTILTRRWKNYDSNGSPKYAWVGGKPSGCIFYYSPGVNLRETVAAAGGDVWIANGEIGVLTFAAAGLENALSWFGERSVPGGLAEHLMALGVRRVLYPVDHDATGQASAVQVRERLSGTNIEFHPLELPDWLPLKGDTNDLWQALSFDKAAFQSTLKNLCPLHLPEPQTSKAEQVPPRKKRERAVTGQKVNWPEEQSVWWRETVLPIVERVAPRVRGKHAYCPNPAHQDQRPSFRISRDKGGDGWPVCTCGIQNEKNARDIVAGWVGAPLFLEWWKAERAPLFRKVARTRSKQSQPFSERVTPHESPPFPADIEVDMRYISEMKLDLTGTYSGVLIKSPTNTGKTELVKRVIEQLRQKLGREPRVLILTHRQSLAANIAERLGVECYKNFTGKLSPMLHQIPQLVIVCNSLPKLVHVGEKLPSYDLIVIDEIDQFLQHLGSATFRKGEALRAYKILRQFMSETPLVIGLDAYLSYVSKEWLEDIQGKGKVVAILNKFKPRKGRIVIHARREMVVKVACEFISEAGQPTGMTVGSKKTAKQLHRLFSDSLPSEAVGLICGDNSETKECQQLINHINQELPKLKVLINTTSLGTGVDIQTPTRGVCAIFDLRPLDAYDCHQMIARYRHTQEIHVYIPASEGNRETDWGNIYQKHERNAVKTGIVCSFDEQGVYSVTPDQQSVLKLLSKFEAEKNRSQNALLSHFVTQAIADGYEVEFYDGEAPVFREAMNNAGETVAEDEKTAALTAAPIAYEELETYRARGTLSAEILAGHERYKIEDTVGREISSELYDDLHTPPKRERLRRFTDLAEPEAALRGRDVKQAREKHLLGKRRHYLMVSRLIREGIRLVFGDAGLESKEELTHEMIAERLGNIPTTLLNDLQSYLDWRTDQSREPLALLRWLLGRVDMKLQKRQVTREGKRFYLYSIDRVQLQKMRDYEATRRKHLASKEQMQEPIT